MIPEGYEEWESSPFLVAVWGRGRGTYEREWIGVGVRGRIGVVRCGFIYTTVFAISLLKILLLAKVS